MSSGDEVSRVAADDGDPTLTDIDVTAARLTDAVEAAACRELYAAAPPTLARELGLQTLEIGRATLLLAPGLPDPFFNRVIGLGVHEATSEAQLDAVIAAYARAGVKGWWIHFMPIAEPAELQQWLEQRDFELPQRKSWAKVLRGAEAPQAMTVDFDVRRALPGEEGAVAETICAAYGMPNAFAPWFEAVARAPGWRAYVAVDAGRVGGAGLLHLQDDKAWLGAGGVRPESRGRHVHRALMLLRIREAIEAGCTSLVTETGDPVGDEPNPSLANMQWCGFKKVCSRLNYSAPA